MQGYTMSNEGQKKKIKKNKESINSYIPWLFASNIAQSYIPKSIRETLESKTHYLHPIFSPVYYKKENSLICYQFSQSINHL
jgi:hypothetical protein